MKEIQTKSANEVLNESYVEISKYVARTRAYTSMIDGLKSVYRRMLYASRNIKGKTKAMEFIAATLVYHPHGDSGCTDALVSMTCEYNPLPLFKGYGNFGGAGFGASAPRYLSAELNDIGRLMYLELVDYADYVEGDAGEMEPTYLPALIPYALICGSKGMTVGLPTPNIPSFNLMELINYFRNRLQGMSSTYPKIDIGKAYMYGRGVQDLSKLYETGIDKVEYCSIVNYNGNVVNIDSFPPNTRIWNLQKDMEEYISQEVVNFSDTTSGKGISYQYELNNSDILPYSKFIDMVDSRTWSSDSYRMYFEKDSNVHICSFNQIVDECLKYLRKCAVRKFDHDIDTLNHKMEVIRALSEFKSKYGIETLDQIKSRPASYYKNEMIEKGFSAEAANAAWAKSMTYITSDHDSELPEMEKELSYLKRMQKDPTEYLVGLYDRLEELVKPIYENKDHTEWYYPQDFDKFGVHLIDGKLEVNLSSKKYKRFDKYIYALTKDGIIYKVELPKIRGLRYYLENVSGVITDSSDIKYIVIQKDDSSLIAFSVDRFQEGANEFVKTTKESEYTHIYGINSDKVRYTVSDEESEYSISIEISSIIKDSNRKVFPIYITENIISVKDE